MDHINSQPQNPLIHPNPLGVLVVEHSCSDAELEQVRAALRLWKERHNNTPVGEGQYWGRNEEDHTCWFGFRPTISKAAFDDLHDTLLAFFIPKFELLRRG